MDVKVLEVGREMRSVTFSVFLESYLVARSRFRDWCHGDVIVCECSLSYFADESGWSVHTWKPKSWMLDTGSRNLGLGCRISGDSKSVI